MTQRSRSDDGVDLDEGGFDLDAPTPSRRGAARSRARDDGGDDGASEGGDGGGAPHGGRVRGVLQRSWPEAAPVWLRGPAAVVAVAVVAAAVGGVFATHQQRASLDQALAVERVLGAVDVVSTDTSAARYDENGDAVTGGDGRTEVLISISLTNTSDTPTSVTVTGVEVGAVGVPLTILGAAAPQQLDALDTRMAVLDAEVDCAAVPQVDASGPASDTDWVVGTAVVADEERAVRWGARSDWSTLSQQLSSICHQTQSAWVDLDAVELLSDGRVRVDVVNSGQVAGELDVLSPFDEIVSDPALPLVVEGDEQASVVLTAVPDCSRVGDLLDQGVRVTVTTPDDPGGGYEITDSGQLSAWMGRQTALTCS